MINQVKEANESALDISAKRLEECTIVDVDAGQHNLLFGSPETWLDNKTWRDMLSSSVYKKNVVAIVIDEAHLVTW